LRAKDPGSFGRQLNASHRASSRWLWNIVAEVDRLQSCALTLGAQGASGFGAGFGGSALALVAAARAGAFAKEWRACYLASCPEREDADFFCVRPGPGIEVWAEAGLTRFVDRLFPGS
jgi:galactokinase